jgi:predicted Rossmann fold flavoprotein
MLLRECHDAGVTVMTSCSVQEVKKGEQFQFSTSRGPFTANALIIATGGLSFAKLGATDFGYQIARQFGLVITPLRPALVPLTFIPEDRHFCTNLAGLSLPVRVKQNRAHSFSFEESILFTHRGVSGPAILQISSNWNPGEKLYFDFLPSDVTQQLLQTRRQSSALISNLLSQHLPHRFAEAWCERFHFSKLARHYSDQEFATLLELLHQTPMSFLETEGYPKAEVTRGGVATSELSSKTMESHRVPGLYFIGEVVDVTGWLGGYNFQWAWASAHAAAEAV